MAAALTGETFMNSWNGRSVYDLFIRIQTMPQDDPGSLTSAACREIVAFLLLQSNKFPFGNADLGSGDALKKIVILREKP